MKHNRLFWFLILLICVSLSCNLPVPVVITGTWGVYSVSVTPPSGPGSFRVSVSGGAYNGNTLRCYISAEGGNVEKFVKTLQYTVEIDETFPFAESFTFSYTVPGTHSLVCMIDNNVKTAWSDDFMVTPATLTITASSDTMTYGGTAPTITPAYSGFVAGDTVSSLTTAPTCSTTATSTSPVGSYPSSCSGAVGANYTIGYTDGSVSVTPATLTISASSDTMTYGGTVPPIAPTYSGFVAGDTASSLTTAPICSTTATSTSPVGSYPSSCSGAVGANYTISYTAGSVSVTPTATPATWYIRVYNVDDLGTAYVNGSKITEIQFAQDSDWIDVTTYFSAPTNSVRFTMWNGEYGYAWGFAIKRDGVVVWSDVQGEVNVMGANNNDQDRINMTVYDRTIVVNQSGEVTIEP